MTDPVNQTATQLSRSDTVEPQPCWVMKWKWLIHKEMQLENIISHIVNMHVSAY